MAQAQPAAAPTSRQVDGLFDLRLTRNPGGDITSPSQPHTAIGARQLVDLVVDAGGAGDDLRLLLDDGARSAAVFGEVAGLLGCDVLVSPAGSRLIWRTGEDGRRDPVPVDGSGRAADWQVIQPPELATPLPGWFTLADGLVHRRTGTVTLPLPGGLALATRADFAARRADAYRLGAGHPDLTTVAVTVRAGRFLVGDYDGTQQARSGPGLAAAVADLPLFGTDLRLWLAWPAEPGEQRRLAAQLADLSVVTGATVWTPPVGGFAHVVDGCADLGGLRADGHPAGWRAWTPDGRDAGRFESDRDGRLMPVGPIRLTGASGTVLDGVFKAELPATLDAGRPAAYRADGSLVPLGPAEVEGLLRRLGWTGEDVMLTGPAESGLFAELDVDVWAPPPGAEVSAEGRLSAPHEWRLAHKGTGPGRYSAGGLLVATGPLGVPLHAQATTAPDVVRPAVAPQQPGSGPVSGVDWLPPRPPVNIEPFEVYVACPTSPARAVDDGVPSPDLFLLGRLVPRPVVESRAVQHLLRVRVEPGGAVDLTVFGTRVPSQLQHLININGLYLLPVGWLSRAHVSAGYALTAAGPTCVDRFTDAPVTIRCTGARHGVDGLPNEVVRWPEGSSRKAWALVPDGPADPELLVLSTRRPDARDGHRLVRLRVPRRRALDAGRSAEDLKGFTALRSRLDTVRGLVLPRRAFERVSVIKVYRSAGGRWHRDPVVPLADLLSHGERPAGPPGAADDDRHGQPAGAGEQLPRLP